MSRILHRQVRGTLPRAVSGRGISIVDSEGKSYLDASGGAAVSCLGHGHPDVVRAMHEQIDKIAYAHTSFFSTPVAEELADHLIAHAPAGMSHVYLVSGGSEAMEAALKLARQYFVESGQPQRRHFIARRQSYHGNTLGALAVGGNVWRRRHCLPRPAARGCNRAGPSGKAGFEQGFMVTGIETPIPQPVKEWLFVPALVVLGGIVLLQRRRLQPAVPRMAPSAG
jgi:adenosylmethionine-8-amino-7-oxononanoate aminotransferase